MIARYAGGEGGARGAARARAAVVVVDAFRASTTIAVLVHGGARVIPAATVEEATETPADFRAGERWSARLTGFEFGNSPSEVLAADVPPGSTVVLTTTNGTRIIRAAAGAAAIFTGAFVNAGALAEALSNSGHEEVHVVGCGWKGHRSSEDEAAAGAILHRIGKFGAELDERARRVVELYHTRPTSFLRDNTAARRLKRLGYEADLDLCLAEDSVPVAPRLVGRAFVGGTQRHAPTTQKMGRMSNAESENLS